MGKLTFGQSKTRAEKVAMATSKGYDTGKKSTGSKPLPKATVSLKGTNPMKGKFAATWKKDL
jgi:hypothetical protein